MAQALDPQEPVDYIVGHLEEALACDERVNEQGLHVTVHGRRIFVDGTVSTKERHAAVAEIVAELLPDWSLVNQATVADFPEPSDMEALS
ncbi:MAG: hypothetical protein QOK43_2013 [Acidimicrobiaceae bacterium]|nr:hypothetical protein [Acidimicrobiaceae bacterium]